MALSCIFLMDKNVKCIFLFFFVMFISCLEKCLFKPIAHFLIELFVCVYDWGLRVLYIFYTRLGQWLANIFASFQPFNSEEQNLLIWSSPIHHWCQELLLQFYILYDTFMIHLEFNFLKYDVEVLLFFLAYQCSIALVPFVENAILPLLNCFWNLSKSVGPVCLHLFLNASVSLIYLFIPSLSCLDH